MLVIINNNIISYIFIHKKYKYNNVFNNFRLSLTDYNIKHTSMNTSLKRSITLCNDNIIFYIFSNINIHQSFQHQTPYFNSNYKIKHISILYFFSTFNCIINDIIIFHIFSNTETFPQTLIIYKFEYTLI